jgi:DNA invertase Pin-like site-specific DNA recombinase
MGNFVSNLVLEVLAFVAEQEKENIRQRQQEGIKIARLATYVRH